MTLTAKKTFPIILVVTTACTRIVAPPAASQYDEFAGIVRLFSRGEYSRVSDTLDLFLKKTRDPVLLGKSSFLLALSAFRQNEWERAVTFFQRAVSSYPPLSDYSQYYLAQALKKRGDSILSLQALEYLVKNYPLSRWRKAAEMDMAGTYFSMGDIDRAMTYFKDIGSRYPAADEYPGVLFSISTCQELKEQTDKAAKGYLALWLTYPLSPWADEARKSFDALVAGGKTTVSQPATEDLWRRAQRMLQESHFKKGEEEIRALLKRVNDEKKDGMIPAILVGLGTYEYYNGMYTEAAASFAEAAKTGKDDMKEQALFWLGKALSQTDKSKARDAFTRLLHVSPTGELAPNALYKIAMLDIGDDKDDEGISRLRDIIRKFPESPVAAEALWDAGWSLYLLGRYDGALDLFHTLKRNRFSTPEVVHQALYWQARAEEEKGDKDSAKELFMTFQGMPPGYYELMARWRLTKMGFLFTPAAAQGAGTSHTPSSSLPPDILYHYQRARELMDLSMNDDAKEELSYVSEKGRFDRDTLLHLSDLYRDIGEFTLSQYLPRVYLQGELEKPPMADTLDTWRAAYPVGQRALVEEYTQQYSLPPRLLYAVILEESRYQPTIVSRANAMGLMQIIPPTGSFAAQKTRFKGFSPEMLFDPGINIGLGAWYLKQLSVQFQGNLILTLASYNAGPTRVLSWLRDTDSEEADEFVEEIPFPETREYVKKVLGSLEAYNRLFGGDINMNRALPLPQKIKEKVDLKALGVNTQ